MPQEPHKDHEKAKIYDTERWAPPVGRCPICYLGKVEKQFQKEWGGRQKQKQSSVVDVVGGENKVWCCKEQYVSILPKTKETTPCVEITRWSIPKSDCDVLLLQKGYFIWALHYPLWDKCGVQL